MLAENLEGTSVNTRLVDLDLRTIGISVPLVFGLAGAVYGVPSALSSDPADVGPAGTRRCLEHPNTRCLDAIARLNVGNAESDPRARMGVGIVNGCLKRSGPVKVAVDNHADAIGPRSMFRTIKLTFVAALSVSPSLTTSWNVRRVFLLYQRSGEPGLLTVGLSNSTAGPAI